MSLLGSMTRDLGQIQRVNINEVRVNLLNSMIYDAVSEEILDGLMSSCLEHGQMENAIAYRSDSDFHDEIDGRKYTLVGGNTRYLAIKRLYEKGLGDGYINISIIEKPKNRIEELKLLVTNNIQRRKSPEERYHEIQIFTKVYDELDEKPEGTKRDWIGNQLGISGRYVDKLLNKFEGDSNKNEENNIDNPSTENDNDTELEGQISIYDYDNDDEVLNETANDLLTVNTDDITLNANNAATNSDIVKMLQSHVKSITKTIRTAEEIGLRNVESELRDIQVILKELINDIS